MRITMKNAVLVTPAVLLLACSNTPAQQSAGVAGPGDVAAQVGDRTISVHRRYAIQAGRTRTIRVRLTTGGYAVLRRLGSATVVIRGDDGDRFGRYGDHVIRIET